MDKTNKEMRTMKETKQQEEYRRLCYGIANKRSMRINEVYADFMLERFPLERDELYIMEWADRFMSGNPASYMDSESYEIYERIVRKKRGLTN
jgi:hypothetical protein